MDMTPEEYVDMLAGYDSGGEGTSGVGEYDEDSGDEGTSGVDEDEDVTTGLLDFESTINTKKLKAHVPFSKRKHHNQRYLNNVLKPIDEASPVIRRIHDTGEADFGQLKSLLKLTGSLGSQEEKYSKKDKKKEGKRLVTEAKVSEVHGYREKLETLIVMHGAVCVQGLAGQIPPADEEQQGEIDTFIRMLTEGDPDVVGLLVQVGTPDPAQLVTVLECCPQNKLETLASRLVRACGRAPGYLQVLIEHAIAHEAPNESPADYFRQNPLSMKLLRHQKASGELDEYLQRVGTDVQELIARIDVPLEPQPSRRPPPVPEPVGKGKETAEPEPEVPEPRHPPLEQVIDAYLRMAQRLLDSIDAGAVPDPLCRCCRILYEGFVAQTGNRAGAREKVSSFLFIRYISPLFSNDMIANPPGGKKLSRDQQRIGIMLGKILQGVGNQIPFSEQYMRPFNVLVNGYAEAIDHLATDVLRRAGVANP
ncbi:GTPase-activator protein for Ras-like GTPase [Maioricimonas rarisocia]|uniref:GTPase-activator protein for Ras-like GTPase n=1 Tax=Maioricimonas rarisocia TaxID=2528026 RepID=A0A517ZFI6_9PLAN|nr:RasGAP domain-containing protein [Maioricimonas rarisocia]QDU41231.1 GTPase-activator protein for Ras-like GTPase [Maioricimonas rarisocia]